MLSISETAKRLRCHERSVYNWIHNGKLRAYKIGSRWRIMESEIERYLSEHDSQPANYICTACGGKMDFPPDTLVCPYCFTASDFKEIGDDCTGNDSGSGSDPDEAESEDDYDRNS